MNQVKKAATRAGYVVRGFRWRSVRNWSKRAKWRKFVYWTLVVNLILLIPGYALVSYGLSLESSAADRAMLEAEGITGIKMWFWTVYALEFYLLPISAMVGLLVALMAKPDPRGSRKYNRKVRADDVPTQIWLDPDPLQKVRTTALYGGAGAFLGWRQREDGARTWVGAHCEASVLVLAPPRGGKTSGVIQQSVVSAVGPVVVTSIKRDVMERTAAIRSRVGTVWHFDPSGRDLAPPGATPLRWSPVVSAKTWDQATIVATAMTSTVGMTGTSGTTSNEQHFTDKAADLLAPLLLAAHHSGQTMAEVADWVYTGKIGPPAAFLQQMTDARGSYSEGAHLAAMKLYAVQQLADRERSSAFSTAQRAVSAFMMEGPRLAATEINFDPHAFVRSSDTVYVTATDDVQRVTAPLVVGLLAAIKQATYERQRMISAGLEPSRPPVSMLLDEAANIAPIQDLPSWLSTAGGNGMHMVVVFQDLSQAAERWGHHVADGLMTLCTTKLIFGGIGDPKTLHAFSEYVGNFDRRMVSHTSGSSLAAVPMGSVPMFMRMPSNSTTVHYQRQAVMEPGQIAQIPNGQALLIDRNHYEVIATSSWHDQSQPWHRLEAPPARTIDITNSPTANQRV